jgi:hypothetical protein
MPNPAAGVELNVPELAVAVRVSPPAIVDPDAKLSKSAWACPALVLLPNVKVCAEADRLNAAIVMRAIRCVCGFIFLYNY